MEHISTIEPWRRKSFSKRYRLFNPVSRETRKGLYSNRIKEVMVSYHLKQHALSPNQGENDSALLQELILGQP